MANVDHLEAGAQPPQDENCLIVTRDLTGAFYVSRAEGKDEAAAAPMEYPISDADRTAVIDRAKAHADRFGIPNIYVVA